MFQSDKFNYIDKGEGEVLILLHGLFSNLANFQHTVKHFSSDYRVIVPFFPVLEMPLDATNIDGLVEFLEAFTEELQLSQFTIVGNSLGGHVGIEFTLKHPSKVDALVLTGSSGLFDKDRPSNEVPKRGNYEYIRNKTQMTFYNPELATKDIVDEVFDIVNDRQKAMRVLYMAKSAVRNNLRDQLQHLCVPVFLIWGENDCITPPSVAQEFKKLIPHAQLAWINECGHAAMMEHPSAFNELLDGFLRSIKQIA